MSNKNRLVLLTFLTMNVLLIIISIVRVSSYERDGVFDVRWTMFFQYLEPNIAILAACFTALRSLFVRRSSQAHGVEEGPVFLFQQKLFKQRSLDCRLLDDLPTVPEAAQTGSRTEI